MILILSAVRHNIIIHIYCRICHHIPREMPLHQFSRPLAPQSHLTHIIEEDADAPCDVACVISINVNTGLIRSGWYGLITEPAHATCTLQRQTLQRANIEVLPLLHSTHESGVFNDGIDEMA